MTYPTLEQVEAADRYQLCKWHRFLRSPENETEIVINKRLFERWKEAGGFTPAISKAIGWTLILLFPFLLSAQSWYPQKYAFGSLQVDPRNALFGSEVNEPALDLVYSVGYRNGSFHSQFNFESFPEIEYTSAGIDLGYIFKPGHVLQAVGSIELLMINRPWKVAPGIGFNARLEYHLQNFIAFARSEYKYRGDWQIWKPSGYLGIAYKLNF